MLLYPEKVVLKCRIHEEFYTSRKRSLRLKAMLALCPGNGFPFIGFA